MAKSKIVDVVTKLVELMTELESEERQRAVQAAFTILGEGSLPPQQKADFSKRDTAPDSKTGFPPKVQVWMSQNKVTHEELDQVFHIDGKKAHIIAATIPGRTAKDKVLNAYILKGLSNFVVTGEGSFDDKSARGICIEGGFYDPTNHSRYIGSKGNKLTGSKEQGWTLTSPGLIYAATMLHQIVSPTAQNK